MKVLFVTNVPSPYRVDFFNELGKYCELTVCFERKEASDRDKNWKGSGINNFREIYADVKPIGTDQSKGKGIVCVIKQTKFDHLVISGYASPAVRKAIFYCQRKHVPYIIESDGGFLKKDNLIKKILKKLLLCKADKHFTTCEEHIQYLISLGVEESRIIKYPFTSLKKEDILKVPPSIEEKQRIRQKLGITEDKVILSIGQFIHRKGYDILLKAAKDLSQDIGLYLIGGEPTEEYINLKTRQTHFINFIKKEELKEWYMAADCFVLPTREDIWGLVINEAMAFGLPVITTDKCIAGKELVRDGKNGYIVCVEDVKGLSFRICQLMNNYGLLQAMSTEVLRTIQNYTIENMAKTHIKVLENSNKRF